MDTIISLDKFILPIGKQQIELQQIVYESGGMPLMRVRIREGSRFTVFDMDRDSAGHWGRAMLAWAQGEPA